MNGRLHALPRFDLVVRYMDYSPADLNTMIYELRRKIIGAIMRYGPPPLPSPSEWTEVIDKLTAFCIERADLCAVYPVLADDVVQASLPALREAWAQLKGRVTPHEAENILRDPPPARETYDLSVLRKAWLPVSVAGSAALLAARSA